MADRGNLLYALLETLVQEWGVGRVSAALDDIALANEHRNRFGTDNSSLRANKGRQQKSAAVEQVERAKLTGDQARLLGQVAVLYDQKKILPSLADTKEFLILMGQRPGAIKDRSNAFRLLLNEMRKLPIEKLENLSVQVLDSGPARLGPLSEAIAQAAESRYSINEHADATPTNTNASD